MEMSRREAIRKHYEHRIRPDRESYQVLDWLSPASQRTRFEVLAREVDLEGRSLLDVGSGLGDLWAFLKERGIRASYTGVDILEDMVAEASRRHPAAEFVLGDIFRADLFGDRRFDVVFCSGAFNLNLGNNREFLPAAVRRMAERAREYVVFNLLHARCPASDPRYAHYDPREVVEDIAGEQLDIRVVEDYLPNDFTVVCRLRTAH